MQIMFRRVAFRENMKLALDSELIRRANDFYNELYSIVLEYEQIDKNVDNPGNESALSQQEELKRVSLEDAINVVNAFIKVASVHADANASCETMLPYDRAKLVALQVQIDPHSHNDEKAAELLREAHGQLNMLNKELRQHLHSVDERKAQVEAQKERSQNARLGKKCSLIERYNSLLGTTAFSSFLADCETSISADMDVVMGTGIIRLPLPESAKMAFQESIIAPAAPAFIKNDNAISLPITVNMKTGGAVYAEADKAADESSIGSIAVFLLNIFDTLRSKGTLENAAYLDPITFSPLSLGIMSELACGDSPLFNEVPRSPEEMRTFFSNLSSTMNRFDERRLNNGATVGVSDVFVFRDYPNAYDESALRLIRKLVLMAESYGVIAILQGTPCEAAGTPAGLFEETAGRCLRIENDGGKAFILGSPFGRIEFNWMPRHEDATDTINTLIDYMTHGSNEDNAYVARIGDKPFKNAIKGNRAIREIPVGLSSDGSIVSLSFENENFAAFIGGASRSGKSTLLHTFLTGVFLSKHPDDVEIWLVDFKMTEFSRYTACPPPHIRYIVLDESPELVYDLLDRLTEIMLKRQSIFKKNGWVKLSDAQAAERYMPALLIVIDEFSVMSKIVADAAVAGKDYKDKLQMLLAKGAALGFRFVFASQGFTQGTRGLSDYSKKQIQQRIAMKTDYAEIKDTLDLPSVTDDDRRVMESLIPHYALLKIPGASSGDHLKKMHVLFFNDNAEQYRLLSPIMECYTPAEAYSVSDFNSYIDKKVQVFDGNELTDYASACSIVKASINQLLADSFDPSSIFMCFGQPLRMRECTPIELVDGYAENILFCAPIAKGEAFQSAVATMAASASAQSIRINILVPHATPLMPKHGFAGIPNVHVCCGMANIESYLTEATGARGFDSTRSLTVVLCPESLFQGDSSIQAPALSRQEAIINIPKRDDGEDDLQTKLLKGALEVSAKLSVVHADADTMREDPSAAMERCNALFGLTAKSGSEDSNSADLGSELLRLMEQGSKRGDHFMLVVPNLKEIKKWGVSLDWFRHRLAFRIPQEDAREFMPRPDASVASELVDHCFRYTNGLDGITFRPYSHDSLGIFADKEFDDLDEYLL